MIKNKFRLSDRVKVAPLDGTYGLVISIAYDAAGLWYKVRYFMHGKAEEVFFLEEELN